MPRNFQVHDLSLIPTTSTVFVIVLVQNFSYENLPYSHIHLRKKIELSFIRKFCTSTNFEQSQKET